MTVDAVLRNLEVIGEAARFIPDAIAARYPDIPWLRIRAFRNIVAHRYFSIDRNLVWDTVQTNLKPLKRTVTRIKAEE